MLKNKKPTKKILNKEDVRYVIYCRKSRDEGSDWQKQSLLDQLQSCLNEAERKWLNLAQKSELTDQYFRDDQYFRRVAECQSPHEKNIIEKADWIFYIIEQASAKEPNNRPLRTQLIKLVKQWKINGILSYTPDRHARNLVESGELIQLLNEYYLDVQYTNFSFENNENGRMILWITFVISYNYSDNLAKVTARWKEWANNRWQADGKYKYWYLINEQKYHEPDPLFFKVWQEAFRRKIYENPSDEILWKFIVSSGFKRKYKKDKRETELNKKTLYKIWLDPFYYWILISWNNEIDLRNWSNPHYEPLITEEDI
jgi:DNA invertase Pin-like site-specific DNA recombinase